MTATDHTAPTGGGRIDFRVTKGNPGPDDIAAIAALLEQHLLRPGPPGGNDGPSDRAHWDRSASDYRPPGAWSS